MPKCQTTGPTHRRKRGEGVARFESEFVRELTLACADPFTGGKRGEGGVAADSKVSSLENSLRRARSRPGRAPPSLATQLP